MANKQGFDRLGWPGQSGEEGQSLVEVTLSICLLLFLLLGIYEMSQVFLTYMALVNAAREGAAYAALHWELTDSTKTEAVASCAEGNSWCSFANRVTGELDANMLNPSNPTFFTVTESRPFGNGPDGSGPGKTTYYLGYNCPITVTVTYHLYTFTSQMSVPIFERMGLPDHYDLSYSASMPIRTPKPKQNTDDCMCRLGEIPYDLTNCDLRQ